MAVADSQTVVTETERERSMFTETWLHAVNNLFTQAEQWSHEQGWTTERRDEILDEDNGPYPVPVLTVTTPGGPIALEPIARLVIGAEGRVDFYALPTMARVKLLLKRDSRWVIRTDSGIDWPSAWGQETFYQLVHGLLHTE